MLKVRNRRIPGDQVSVLRRYPVVEKSKLRPVLAALPPASRAPALAVHPTSPDTRGEQGRVSLASKCRTSSGRFHTTSIHDVPKLDGHDDYCASLRRTS